MVTFHRRSLSGLSPSTVSKQVSRLEGELGVRLLVRTTREVHPTDEGEALLGHALRIVDAVDGAERALAELREVPHGVLRVNASVPFAHRVLVPRLAAFQAEHPRVELDLSVTGGVIRR